MPRLTVTSGGRFLTIPGTAVIIAFMSPISSNRWVSAVAACLETPAERLRMAPVRGGDIADSYRIVSGSGIAFLKVMEADGDPLSAEADGLRALYGAAGPRVPEILGYGREADGEWLLLEWLDLGPLSGRSWEIFGEALARQHGHTGPDFGWKRANYIGRTPQPNDRHPNWATFFRDMRLGYQLRLASGRGLDAGTAESVERVRAVIDAFFDRDPEPSLLHGDLWSGNVASAAGEPVVFDPAVYFGDAEADLAMLELFGAPPDAFWNAYRSIRAIDAGYPVRRDLYNLYHLLNHFNLFGGAYAGQVLRYCRRLLSEVQA